MRTDDGAARFRGRIEQQYDERIERKKREDGGRSTGQKKGREKERERVMRGARDTGSARCTKKRRQKQRERKGRRTRNGKNGKGGQGNKNVVDEGSCTCGGATVRTWRVYLSCFYRLARTSGPGYADEDEDDDDGDDDEDDGDDDEEKARNKVGEGRTTRSGERWKVAAQEGLATAGGRG